MQVGAPGRRSVDRRRSCRAPSSRSGQIGKKTAHHCSGRVLDDPLERRRRAPSSSPSRARARAVGRAPRSARGGRGSARRPTRRTPTTYGGAPLSTASIAGPSGSVGRGPEERDRRSRRRSGRDRRRGRPPSRRGAPPSSSRRASRRPTIRTPVAPRVRTNQACSAGSSMVSIGATAPPTRAARNRPGSSIEPKWRPTKIDRRPVAERLGDDLGRLDGHQPVDDPPGRMRRRPGHLEVVAGVVPERRADEALQGARVRRRRRGRAGLAAPVAASATHDAPEVAPGLGRRSGRERGTRGRPRGRRGGPADPPGSRQASHEAADEDAPAQPATERRTWPPRPRRSPSRPASGRRREPAARARVGPPACIASARRSRSAASSAVAGQIGLKLYHWSGAAADRRASASAMRLGRPLELGRIGRRRRRSGSAQVTSSGRRAGGGW